MGEAYELDVLHRRSARLPLVLHDDRAHLIEQRLRRHAAEKGESLLAARHEGAHVLAGEKPHPHQP
jgi:hypothetical protein